MKAGVSSPEGLMLGDIPQPVPKPNEVLARVKACGLNRADLSAAKASFGHGVMGAALGLEWAGEVVAGRAHAEAIHAGLPAGGPGDGGAYPGRAFRHPPAPLPPPAAPGAPSP